MEGFMARNLSPRHRSLSDSDALHYSRPFAEGGTMFVSDILAQKGGLVYTVTPGTSIAQLSQQLSTRRIGSVLVLDGEGAVAGIVSERDLVRALASHGAKAMELEARQVMTRDVVTCDPDDSIDRVMQTMTQGRFRHLPVVRHGELLGLVSIGDVVKARLEETKHETEALKAYIVAG
jgi:CBS domain-containing protein